MILLENVSKKYKDKIIFDNVNLILDRVGLYLIRGDNGVGKSTLLNIIGGFTRVSGKVINDYKKNMGYVFQNSFLINELKVIDNLRAFNIKADILKDYKMEDKLEEYVYNLSNGQKQRLAFIIATRDENVLVLLDEVLSNLDKENEKIIIDKILEMKNRKMIILVSHKYEILSKYIDGIIEIKNKKIIFNYINVLNTLSNTKATSNKLNVKSKCNYKMYFICFGCFLIYLFLILLSIGSKNLIHRDISNTVDYNKFYLKQCNISNSNDNFSVSKCSNPSDAMLELLERKDIKYGFNYDYLLANVYRNENISIIDHKDMMLKKGRYPSKYNEIVVSDDYSLGDKIILEADLIVGNRVIDIYKKELVLEVVGIYNDLLFLNQDKIYLDYELIDKYYKEEMLVNNNMSLFEYFYNLDIPSYKYVSFTSEFIDELKFEGATYSYYKGIEDIFLKVEGLIKYLKNLIIIFIVYILYRIYKNRLIEIQKNCSFLMANSFSKIEIIINYFKNDLLFFLVGFLFSLFLLIITTSYSYLIEITIFFSIIMFFVVSLIFSFLSRKAISRLMLEEIW